MQELNDLLHIADFVREKFDDGFVSAHFAELA